MSRIAAAVISFALMLPASALAAGGSTCSAYSGQTCNTPTNTVGGTSTSVTPSNEVESTSVSTGWLPFTGLDAALLVAGGLSLVGIGLVVRHVAGRQS